jgi:hypothetical protein
VPVLLVASLVIDIKPVIKSNAQYGGKFERKITKGISRHRVAAEKLMFGDPLTDIFDQ